MRCWCRRARLIIALSRFLPACPLLHLSAFQPVRRDVFNSPRGVGFGQALWLCNRAPLVLLLCLSFPSLLSLSLVFTFSCIGGFNCLEMLLEFPSGFECVTYTTSVCLLCWRVPPGHRGGRMAALHKLRLSHCALSLCLVLPLRTLSTRFLNLQYSSVWEDSLLAVPLFFSFYILILCYLYLFSGSARTLSPQCNGSPSGTHAFKHVCLNSCQGLVGETKFACSSVSPRDTDYISMSSRPGRGKSRPLKGGRSLGPRCNTSR